VVAAALLDERRRRWLEKLLVGTGGARGPTNGKREFMRRPVDGEP
jgi:hypothetical protein